jgi:hypothetical protein
MNDRRHSSETKTSTSKKTKKNPLYRSLTNLSKSLSGIIKNKSNKHENGSKKLDVSFFFYVIYKIKLQSLKLNIFNRKNLKKKQI